MVAQTETATLSRFCGFYECGCSFYHADFGLAVFAEEAQVLYHLFCVH